MSDHQQALGDFDFRTVAGTFQLRLAELQPDTPLHGMQLQSQYLYGGLRSADGTMFVVERKFAGPMSGGLYLMSNEGGELKLLPGSIRSARGELVRQFTPDTRHWSDHLMHKVGAEMAPAGEQGLDLTIDDHSMNWSEGELLNLTGSVTGSGVQFYSPMRTEPLLYGSQAFWVKGTMLGTPVEGAIFFDHLYFRHGIEWKEYTWYKDIQVSWNVFGNLFDDGIVEFGHIVRGRRGWNVGVVAEGTEIIGVSTDVRGDFALDGDDFVAGATYDLGDAQWEFTADPDGRMSGFNKARWGGYRAQGGITRRKGDTRTLVNGWTWLECFADRIRGEGLTHS